MATKKKSTSEKAKRGRVQLGKLGLSRETIKDLSSAEKKQIKGGAGALKRKADPDEGGE